MLEVREKEERLGVLWEEEDHSLYRSREGAALGAQTMWGGGAPAPLLDSTWPSLPALLWPLLLGRIAPMGLTSGEAHLRWAAPKIKIYLIISYTN